MPVFIITNKKGTVRFIKNYCRLKQQLVRNPHNLPRIGNTTQKLEVFQYATTLYINMGCSMIRLYNASEEMKMIMTEFGKFRYNCLPVGMCASGDISQSKVYEILDDINGVKTYIDDIYPLQQSINLYYHLQKIIHHIQLVCHKLLYHINLKIKTVLQLKTR